MIPAAGLFEQDRLALERLEQRDRGALLIYMLSIAVVVLAGEAGAFYLQLAERHGFMPLLLRGVAYLLLSTLLWAMVLRASRRRVTGLMEDKRLGYESILLAYDGALALRDTYTGGHGRRVAHYARFIARAMDLPETEVTHIGEAALLHDLGKIGIPDRILTKPSRLTIEEFAEVQKHPAAGADILRAIPPLRRHAIAVRHHHERFNGSGYPDGLRGTAIPRAARIIAIADAFDAMTSKRSYRNGVKAQQALSEITRVAGSHFDPEIVAVISQSPVREALFAAQGALS
ncbi:MAG: HD domain-containing protein [Sulfuricella denitrificans]|nr:HD domain-containing protein [Sulfuricella denitrificans]